MCICWCVTEITGGAETLEYKLKLHKWKIQDREFRLIVIYIQIVVYWDVKLKTKPNATHTQVFQAAFFGFVKKPL